MRSLSSVVLLTLFLAGQLVLVAASHGQVRSAPPPPPPPPPAAKKPTAPPPPPPANNTAQPAGTPATNNKPASKPAVWGNKADDAPDAAGVRRLLPIANHDTKLVFAPAPSPMVAIDNVVFDAAAGKEVGKIPAGLKDVDLKFALSPSGKYFARTSKKMYHVFIEVVDTQSGEVKHSLEYAEGDFQNVAFMQFTKHDHLLAAVPAPLSAGKLMLWRMDTGKVLKDLDTKRLDGNKIAVSDSGQYVAAVVDSRLQVFDFTKGKAVAEMQQPPKESGIVGGFIFVSSLAFSPDTSELAAIMTGQNAEHHLVVWGADGKIIERHNLGLTIRPGYYLDGPLQWAADAQGWLLHGNSFVDRQLKAVAWIYEPPVQHHYPHKLLDNEHLVATQGDFSTRNLVTVEIPRKAIAAAAASLNGGAAALLKPGDTVELRVEVGAVRFSNPGEVVAEIEKNVAQRLKDGGLTVGAGGQAVLSVKYSEGQGNELRVVEGRGPFGKDTGQRVQETVAILEARLTSGGKTIWEETAKRGNPHHIMGNVVSDAAVRDATFKGIAYMLRTLQIPYFVPADENAIRLPIRVSLEE
jgi:hypothetical protein